VTSPRVTNADRDRARRLVLAHLVGSYDANAANTEVGVAEALAAERARTVAACVARIREAVGQVSPEAAIVVSALAGCVEREMGDGDE
jgi:hypothetical protein